MPESDFFAALRALHAVEVEFVVVGGLAAVLNGAPVNTFDLDIVPARDEQNVARLLRALQGIDAIYRMQPDRRFEPDATLDVLGTIGSGPGYADLLPHTVELDIGEEVRVRVLDLTTLIALKEQLGGEKDLAVLPVLRRTLELKQRAGQ